MRKAIMFAAAALAVVGLGLHVLGLGRETAVGNPAHCNEDAVAATLYDRSGLPFAGCQDVDDIDVVTKHHATALVDPADTVAPRKLARYIATHVREMNKRPWHRIGSGPLAGCVQHVGDTTWVVCKDGTVYSS